MDYKEKINELLNDLGQIELRYIYIIVSDVHKETVVNGRQNGL